MDLPPPLIFYPQHGHNGCGLACLRMIGAHAGLGAALPVPALRASQPDQGLSLRELLELAAAYGLRGAAFAATYEELAQVAELPCVVLLNHRHYVVVRAINSTTIELADPARGLRQQERDDFVAAWYQPGSGEGIWLQLARPPDAGECAPSLTTSSPGSNAITF